MTEKIHSKKVSEIMATRLEDLIQREVYRAGEKLPSVRELTEEYGVGRSAVRDAITTLQGKGIVYVKHGEGTFVSEYDTAALFNQSPIFPSKANIHDLFEARTLIEAGIAQLAATHRSTDNLLKIRATLPVANDTWKTDYAFHLSIAEAANNETLLHLMETISAKLAKAMISLHQVISDRDDLKDIIVSQHTAIYDAIEQTESHRAYDAMQAHLAFVEKLLVQAM
jgi:GntR family transcriptional repressor for pyruvate dehydrogenase complex